MRKITLKTFKFLENKVPAARFEPATCRDQLSVFHFSPKLKIKQRYYLQPTALPLSYKGRDL